ncbi:MAG: serine/threonine protein kinase [Polyangiaceae bacterium]|nr:serine/threonine protein kinase [Polyangiaceae bacterium]
MSDSPSDAGADDEESYEGVVIDGKYRIDALVGRGGMGTVWAATHVDLASKLAIKLIRPQYAEKADARRRFEIEARAAAQVNSPHAVRVYDYGVTDAGIPYIVMEYLEGESLSEAILRRGSIPLEEISKILNQAARALEKAHERGIVHRDLKPDNFFLASNVEERNNELPYMVKLVDFGIAKLLDLDGTGLGAGLSGPTQTGMVIGTPTFMSPEQLTEGGEPDALMDVWALGVTMYAAAVGRLPFEGDVLGDIVLKVCVEPLPIPSRQNPRLPAAFDAWFARACSRDRKNRFQTVTEMATTLDAIVNPQAVDHERVQYKLGKVKAPAGEPEVHVDVEDDAPKPKLSPAVALVLGLLLGLSLVAAAVGAIAWKNKVEQEELDNAPPAPTPSASATH